MYRRAAPVVQDARRFVEFLLRIMYASESDLGWDTTIERSLDADGNAQFDISVSGKKYRTTRLLSSIGADSLRGRGTRVWEVKEIDKNDKCIGEPLVLKDSWVDSDRDREWQVLEKIRKSAIDGFHHYSFKNHLPHVREHGDVLVNGKPDDTHKTMRREVDDAIKSGESSLPVLMNPTVRQTVMSKHPAAGALHMPDATKRPLTFGAKTHHRVVFEGVGRTIVEVESLAKAFRYLQDAVYGESSH